jgi:RimJ/RimL family protein N-acetyltransferase
MPDAFLTGEKTILRPVQLTDAPLFTKWMNDQETTRYMLRSFPLTEFEEKSWLEKASIIQPNPTNILMVIETKEDGKTIGTMALHNINWIDRRATTGSMIGEKEYRGKGYATDAKMTFLQYAFEMLGIHKIISHAFAKNRKSVDYSLRCGYHVEATLKDEHFRHGEWQDIISLACFYDGWKKAQAQQQLNK